jgi:hypothetical protein
MPSTKNHSDAPASSAYCGSIHKPNSEGPVGILPKDVNLPIHIKINNAEAEADGNACQKPA